MKRRRRIQQRLQGEVDDQIWSELELKQELWREEEYWEEYDAYMLEECRRESWDDWKRKNDYWNDPWPDYPYDEDGYDEHLDYG